MIRRARASDVAALRAMLQALADHDGGGYGVASEESLRGAGFGARPLFRALLDEDAGQALAMVIYFPDFSTHRGQAGVYVQDIWVDPSARGRGLGRALLAAMMADQDWGAEYVTLGVSPGNALARAVYARLGFRDRGYAAMILDEEGVRALS